MSLGNTIRLKREERDLTQQELADLLHVTRQTVSRWESGSRCPDLILSKKIADTFGISLDDLVSSSDTDSYVPKKTGVPEIKRILAAIFLLTLAVWLMICDLAFSGTAFAGFSMVLVFSASIIFIFGYFDDWAGDN